MRTLVLFPLVDVPNRLRRHKNERLQQFLCDRFFMFGNVADGIPPGSLHARSATSPHKSPFPNRPTKPFTSLPSLAPLPFFPYFQQLASFPPSLVFLNSVVVRSFVLVLNGLGQLCWW